MSQPPWHSRVFRYITNLQTIADNLDAAEDRFAFEGGEFHGEGAVGDLDADSGISIGNRGINTTLVWQQITRCQSTEPSRLPCHPRFILAEFLRH